MKRENVLVTAIYNHSPFSRIGGRGYNIDFYKAPFFNIIKLGLPIVVFTHDNQYEKIKEFFKQVNFTKYELILYDLEQTDITDLVLDYKQKANIIDEHGLLPDVSPIRNDRNHVLCLKKLYFLKYAIDNKLFDGNHYYWIDAGLFHHGLFPDSLGGQEKLIQINEETYWPNNQKSIFRTGLIENLMNRSAQEYIFIRTNSIYGSPHWWSELYNDVNFLGHVVGGLFGGDVAVTSHIHDEFYAILPKLFNHGVLPLEEEILSLIHAKHYPHYKPYTFDAWAHDIEFDRCYTGLSTDVRCFYKIFM